MERISLHAENSRYECITGALNGYFKRADVPKGREIAILPNLIPVREENKNVTGINRFEGIKAAVDVFSQKYERVSIVYALPGGDLQRVGKILEFDTLGVDVINLWDEEAKAKFGTNQFEVFDKDGNLLPLEISAIPDNMQLAVICVPKTHDRALFTGSVKNQMGLIGTKGQMHEGYAFGDVTYVLSHYNLMRLQEHLAPSEPLYICDAFEGMGGNGPYGQPLTELGFAMVSKDAVALDSIALLLMNLKTEDGYIVNPAKVAYLFMLAQRAKEGKLQYATLLENADELFSYGNLETNISKEEFVTKVQKIGNLTAHQRIKPMAEASEAIIEAVLTSTAGFEHPEEIIQVLS